ncbi:20672_t:CDS:2 [Dentiscutata erythropus]|uniref:20672_t:CDS:1 n=1 Tax=Dentiscutata erythropus TaxID=1348616 RepID=A0A9N8VXC7_9GLOM|nr:20672_t:CDS:2 [Dentiscutata erythropus]
MDYRAWSFVLEDSFLQFNWGREAKLNTYTSRRFKPKFVGVVLAYLNRDNYTQRCTSDEPDRIIIQRLFPNNKVFRVIVAHDKQEALTMTEHDKQEVLTKRDKKIMTEHDKQEPLTKYYFDKDRPVASFIYFDDTRALIVDFTDEPNDYAEHATDYLLVFYDEKTYKIMSIRINSPKHIRGVNIDEPFFTLNPTYDEERDVFKINFADSISMTTFQKTDLEDVELEIDNEEKLVTILFHNASIKIANIK